MSTQSNDDRLLDDTYIGQKVTFLIISAIVLIFFSIYNFSNLDGEKGDRFALFLHWIFLILFIVQFALHIKYRNEDNDKNKKNSKIYMGVSGLMCIIMIIYFIMYMLMAKPISGSTYKPKPKPVIQDITGRAESIAEYKEYYKNELFNQNRINDDKLNEYGRKLVELHKNMPIFGSNENFNIDTYREILERTKNS